MNWSFKTWAKCKPITATFEDLGLQKKPRDIIKFLELGPPSSTRSFVVARFTGKDGTPVEPIEFSRVETNIRVKYTIAHSKKRFIVICC